MTPNLNKYRLDASYTMPELLNSEVCKDSSLFYNLIKKIYKTNHCNICILIALVTVSITQKLFLRNRKGNYA